MKEAARLFGITLKNKVRDPRFDWYNLTLQALDKHTPDWRGYLLARRSESDRTSRLTEDGSMTVSILTEIDEALHDRLRTALAATDLDEDEAINAAIALWLTIQGRNADATH